MSKRITRELTEQELRFVTEYVSDGNATRAYRAAFDCTGRTTGAVMVAASRHVRKRKVQEEIRAQRAEARKRLCVTPTRLQRELAAIAFADIGDVLDFSDTGKGVRLRPFRDIPPSARKALESVTVQVKGEDSYVVAVKLRDKLSALDKLAKMLGMYQELPPLEVLLMALPPKVAEKVREAIADTISNPTGNGD